MNARLDEFRVHLRETYRVGSELAAMVAYGDLLRCLGDTGGFCKSDIDAFLADAFFVSPARDADWADFADALVKAVPSAHVKPDSRGDVKRLKILYNNLKKQDAWFVNNDGLKEPSHTRHRYLDKRSRD